MSPIDLLKLAVLGLAGIIPFLLIGFACLYVYTLVHDQITPFDDKAELRRGNIAAALSRGGAYLGILIALVGSLTEPNNTYQGELGMFAADGLIATLFFIGAGYAFDYVILHKIDNADQLAAGNKSAGFVEGCGYIAQGVVLSAAFSGGGQEFWPGILSAILFGALGLVTISVVYVLYGLAWKRRAGCWIDQEIANGNLAAGIDAGSLVLAMSITLWFSISGDFTGWTDDIASYFVAALSSIAAVSIGRSLSGLTFARNMGKTQGGTHHSNPAKAIITALVSVGCAFIAGLVTFT